MSGPDPAASRPVGGLTVSDGVRFGSGFALATAAIAVVIVVLWVVVLIFGYHVA